MSRAPAVDDELRDTRRELERLDAQLVHALEDLRTAEALHQDHILRIQTESQRQLTRLQADLDLQVSRLKGDLADARQARDHWRNVAESSSESSSLQPSGASTCATAVATSSMVLQTREVKLLGTEGELKSCLRKIVKLEDEKQVLRNELEASKDECIALRKQTEDLISSRQTLQGSLDHNVKILAERTKQVESLETHKAALEDMLEVERSKGRDMEVELGEVRAGAEERERVAKDKQDKLWTEYQLLQTKNDSFSVFIVDQTRREAVLSHQLDRLQQSQGCSTHSDGQVEDERDKLKKERDELLSVVEGLKAEKNVMSLGMLKLKADLAKERVEQASIAAYGLRANTKRKGSLFPKYSF